MALDIRNSETKDPNKNLKIYNNWVKKRKPLDIKDKEDYKIIIQYLEDISKGLNLSKREALENPEKRILTQKTRLTALCQKIRQHLEKSIIKVTSEDMNKIFNMMKTGEITWGKKRKYTDIYSPQSSFIAFWHWYQKHSKKRENQIIEDITKEIIIHIKKRKELKFHYIDEEKLRKILDYAKPDHKEAITFLYDTGMRAPTEFLNVKVKDITFRNDECHLHIREETTKTFPRKIKLLFSKKRLEERINRLNLKPNDFLFNISPISFNQFLSNAGYKLFGFGEQVVRIKREHKKNRTPRKHKYIRNGLTMYDFRHSSACYWVNIYKKERKLMYRFGWKNSKMIEYYTHFMGIVDDITEDDLYDTTTKTKLEKELKIQKKKVDGLIKFKEENKDLQKQINSIREMFKQKVKSKK